MSGPVITSTQGAETEGPNASMPFGQATQEKALQRQAGMFAFGGGPPKGGQQGQDQPQPAQPPQQAAPPVQPPPSGQQMAAGAFNPPQWNQQAQSWREELAAFAQHPKAGPWLKAMAEIANRKK